MLLGNCCYGTVVETVVVVAAAVVTLVLVLLVDLSHHGWDRDKHPPPPPGVPPAPPSSPSYCFTLLHRPKSILGLSVFYHDFCIKTAYTECQVVNIPLCLVIE